MGKLVLLALALQTPPDKWFGADKLKHFFVSGFAESASYSVLRATHLGHRDALTGASAATLLVGVGKEVSDHRRGGRFSLRDLTWDAGGGATFGALMAQTRR